MKGKGLSRDCTAEEEDKNVEGRYSAFSHRSGTLKCSHGVGLLWSFLCACPFPNNSCAVQ